MRRITSKKDNTIIVQNLDENSWQSEIRNPRFTVAIKENGEKIFTGYLPMCALFLRGRITDDGVKKPFPKKDMVEFRVYTQSGRYFDGKKGRSGCYISCKAWKEVAKKIYENFGARSYIFCYATLEYKKIGEKSHMFAIVKRVFNRGLEDLKLKELEKDTDMFNGGV